MKATGIFSDVELYGTDNKLPLRSHALRRGTGTMLADSGADVQTISNILGHSTLHTLRVYVNPSTEKQNQRKIDAIGILASSVS